MLKSIEFLVIVFNFKIRKNVTGFPKLYRVGFCTFFFFWNCIGFCIDFYPKKGNPMKKTYGLGWVEKIYPFLFLPNSSVFSVFFSAWKTHSIPWFFFCSCLVWRGKVWVKKHQKVPVKISKCEWQFWKKKVFVKIRILNVGKNKNCFRENQKVPL